MDQDSGVDTVTFQRANVISILSLSSPMILHQRIAPDRYAEAYRLILDLIELSHSESPNYD